MVETKQEKEEVSSSPIEKLTPYIGREVVLHVTEGDIRGVLKSLNENLGYAEFLPHVVYEHDGRCYSEEDAPCRISLNLILDHNARYIIRPLRKGHLESMIKSNNSKFDKSQNKIGFNA